MTQLVSSGCCNPWKNDSLIETITLHSAKFNQCRIYACVRQQNSWQDLDFLEVCHSECAKESIRKLDD